MTERPSIAETVRLMIDARIGATPSQAPLVAALTEFVTITCPFVRAGLSAPAMVDTYNAALAALMTVADQEATA